MRVGDQMPNSHILEKLKDRLFAPLEPDAAHMKIDSDPKWVANALDSKSAGLAVDCVLVSSKSRQFDVGGRSVKNDEQSQNAVAVAEIFESTKLFEDRFSKLLPAFEQVGRLGNEAATDFASIKALANHLEQLAGAFQPVKGLEQQLERLSSSFQAVRSLQGRFAEVSNAFGDHLKQLVSALQPAKTFHRQLIELAATFETAAALQERCERLREIFDPSPGPAASNGERNTASPPAELTPATVRGPEPN